LRERDLHAIEGTFRFRNQEPVEVIELPFEIPLAETRPSVTLDVTPAPKPAVPARFEPVSPGEELRVVAALHRIGADLGDPVEIARSEDRIVVTGIGLGAERRQEITRTLEAMPRVAVRFHESDVTDLPAPPLPAGAKRSSAGEEGARLRARIEEHLGGRPAFDRFADRLLESGDGMMAHAHALRRLAERFTPATESLLSAGDRQVLDGIRIEHVRAIRTESVSIDALVNPVLLGIGIRGDAVPVEAPAGTTWQSRAVQHFEAARQVERHLAVVVAGAAVEGGEGALGERLLGALERLRSIGER
jgi:hypothetical protein